MTPFGTAVAQWVAFYALAGGASATLAGLLFVAVSLHIDLIIDEQFPDAQALARQTFYTFLYIIVISLVFLVPAQSPNGVGITIFLIGLFALLQEIQIVRESVRYILNVKQSVERAVYLLRRVATPLICHAAMLICAVAILNAQPDALNYLVGVIIVLLANATGNSWNLLLRLAQVKRAMANGEKPPSSRNLNKKSRKDSSPS